MTSKLNLPGAIIFWSYILAALIFTSIAISLILKSSPPQNRNHKHVYLFATLAFISFSALSFNMLRVLVQSYTAYQKQHPTSFSAESTWTWSTHSTLFQDFGNEIVASDARYIWIRSALWITLGVGVWIGGEGAKHEMPFLHLSTFFVLSQILPISFAQNFFYLLLLRQSSTPSTRHVSLRTWPTVFLFMAYYICQSYARNAYQTSRLIPIILITRILLLVPMALVTTSAEGGLEAIAVIRFTSTFAAGLVGYDLWKILRAGPIVGGEIGEALFEHPAVTALGFDAVLSGISAVLWVWTQGRGLGQREKVM